jgi:ferrous iron transport protein B
MTQPASPTTLHRVLALAGNPNSGKTTLFNQLTGLRQKVANYAGVTVERKSGLYASGQRDIELIDLPGTYALSPRTEEERVASEVILGINKDVPRAQGLLCVVDSTCLEKSLYLALQIIETGIPTAVLLNFSDELALRGARIDVQMLSRLLEVPVVALSASRNEGLTEVRSLIDGWDWKPLPNAHGQLPIVPTAAEITTRRLRAKQIARSVLRNPVGPHPWSDKIDNVVMHQAFGPLIFGAVVLAVFQAIFKGAQPLMNLIDDLFSQMGRFVHDVFPAGAFASFLADGVIAGVGSVIVFLPQILIVFFFIAILEHSGYLARAALVMDRFMSRVGLQGKSFLPLISSYACAVPGIMATRTIENRRDRLATILVAPFMTCSARLPVYAFLIAAFVPDRPLLGHVLGLRAATLLLLYALGFGAAMVTAWLLKSSILRSDRTPFFLEIPPYRLPLVKTIFLFMWDRAKVFLQRAGTIILSASIILWFLASFPRTNGEVVVENSFAGRIGKWMEPAIEPLGFNWKIGVGLLSAQAAREVMVSSLATIYNVESETNTTDLQKAVRSDLTPLGAISLMIFFVFAMQCTSTLAVTRRETGSWKIPAAMFLYMNLWAYAAAFAVFQAGRALGFH